MEGRLDQSEFLHRFHTLSWLLGLIFVFVTIHRFAKKAEEIKATSFQSAVETVEKLQVKLAAFAKKHRSEIQDDPAFRQQFLQMCGPLGVDPLVSQKSFWAKGKVAVVSPKKSCTVP